MLVLALVLGSIALLALWGSGQAKLNRELLRAQHKQNNLFMAQMEKLNEMHEVSFIHRHLRQYGVGGYLATAQDQILKDVEATCQNLDLTPEQAVRYLTEHVRGYEPRQSTGERHPFDDQGANRSADQAQGPG